MKFLHNILDTFLRKIKKCQAILLVLSPWQAGTLNFRKRNWSLALALFLLAVTIKYAEWCLESQKQPSIDVY